ncbi:MAG: FtsX-like permease family protein [Planctomycetes bacterium]|nr:FtsX-like permease family protein [Planctomycetota bacterium]
MNDPPARRVAPATWPWLILTGLLLALLVSPLTRKSGERMHWLVRQDAPKEQYWQSTVTRYEPYLESVSEEQIRSEARDLSRMGSRVHGYPGNRRAAAWIRQKLERMGYEVRSEPVRVAVPIDRGARLVVDGTGEAFTLYGLWPNLVRTSTVPAGGIRGALLDAGHGIFSGPQSPSVEGSIVLMDFDSQDRFIHWRSLGARAILFVESGRVSRGEAEKKFLSTPVGVPRFWVPEPDAPRLRLLAQRGAPVTLSARMTWEEAEGENLWVELPGSDLKDERVVIESYYDSMSVVPALAPGADQACGLIAWLKLAEVFRRHPPRRSVLFLATTGHHLGLAGISEFLFRHGRPKKHREAVRDIVWNDPSIYLSRERFERHGLTFDVSGGRGNRLRVRAAFPSAREVSALLAWDGRERSVRMSDEDSDGFFTAEVELAEIPAAAPRLLLSLALAVVLFGAGFPLLSRFTRRPPLLPALALPVAVFTAGIVFSFRSSASRDEALARAGQTACELRGFRVEGNEQRFPEPTSLAHLVALPLFREPIDFRLMVGLDLSSRSDHLGVFYRGHYLADSRYDFRNQKFFAPFGKSFQDYADDVARRAPGIPSFSNGISPIGGKAWESYLPGHFAFDNEAAVRGGLPGLGLVTAHDARLLADTPHDLEIDSGNLARQIRLLCGLMANALQDDGLLPDSQVRLEDQVRALRGRTVEFDFRRNPFLPDTPVPDALVSLTPPSQLGSLKTFTGVRGRTLLLSGEDGVFFHPFVTLPAFTFEAYRLDPLSGRIHYAVDRGREGAKNFPIDVTMDWDLKNRTLVLFPCESLDLLSLVDPRYLQRLKTIQVLGPSDFAPEQFGASELQGEDGVAVFARRGERIKIIMGSGLIGNQLLLTHTQPPDPADPAARLAARSKGSGFLLDGAEASAGGRILDGTLLHPQLQATLDMMRLNDWRMAELQKYAITNDRLSELHERARDHLAKAERALRLRDYSAYEERISAARGYEAKAYPEVIETMQGTVAGVIFYFALLIPFSYFVERLLIGSPDIRKQIAASAVIFVAIFLILRQVHPAFFISRSPYVIFLAFLILALAVFVATFVVGKFNEQMAEVRRTASKVHHADVGRLSASAAAFMLGISNLKKRKLRTWLTTFTLILLTFTVLSFTSVRTHIAFNPIPLRVAPAYPGVLIRDRNWNELTEDAEEHVRAAFAASEKPASGGGPTAARGVVAPRAWYSSSKAGKQIFVRVAASGGRQADAAAAIGLSFQEALVSGADQILLAGQWLPSDDSLDCLLPDRMADQLGIDRKAVESGEARVQLFGQAFRVRGILDAAAADRMADLDGETLAPIDVQEASPGFGEQETAITLQENVKELKSFQHLSMANVVVVPYRFLRNLGGNLRSMAIRFREDQAGEYPLAVKEFLKRVAMTLFVGVPGRNGERGKVTAYSSIGLSSFTGLQNLVIPILIAALIVLNTMMGAVHERQREIGVYSSVGLAPFHIGALFMAESSVFAVLGAVTGYLAGQVAAKIVTQVGWLGFESGLTLNYSALSAVASTLLVMGVVLLSTLYPAWIASRLAVPDVTRKWKFPDPDGDLWTFEFPFTVSSVQALGLNIFLTHYLEGYKEESVGSFYTHNVQFASEEGPHGIGYRISMEMWLAPYDLGVSQHVDLRAEQTEDRGISSVQLQIRRLSGDVSSWKRVNKRFLSELRKQFLIWRTVPEATKMAYAVEGKEKLASAVA